MRKICLSLIIIITTIASSYSYDWVAKDNEHLRADMIAYAEQFAKEVSGTKAYSILKKFIAEQKQLAKNNDTIWMIGTLKVVNALEREYPPKISGDDITSLIRRKTLELLDYPLHVDNLGVGNSKPLATKDEIKAFTNFCEKYKSRARKKFLEWLNTPAPEDGTIDIFKIYNMGFILRTSKHCLAIDINWEGTDEEAERIASKADLFLFTHAHYDHFSQSMLKAIAKADKPIFLSEDIAPFYDSYNKYVCTSDCLKPVDYDGIKVMSLLGSQNETPCNIFIIEMDNWRIIDNGDNNMLEKERKVAEYPAYDIAITAAWNSVPNILASAMKAENSAGRKLLYIPAHENELSHPVDHRESYHETFSRKDRLGDPDFIYPDYVLLNIGEHYSYSK